MGYGTQLRRSIVDMGSRANSILETISSKSGMKDFVYSDEEDDETEGRRGGGGTTSPRSAATTKPPSRLDGLDFEQSHCYGCMINLGEAFQRVEKGACGEEDDVVDGGDHRPDGVGRDESWDTDYESSIGTGWPSLDTSRGASTKGD